MKSLSEKQFEGMDLEAIKELLKKLDLVGNSDVAKMLNWSRGKVSLYHSRGVFPQAIGEIGGRPIWARSQIESFIKKGGIK